MVSVRSKIETVDSFSGHADHSELLDWFQHTTGPNTGPGSSTANPTAPKSLTSSSSYHLFKLK
jgi:hypothetical protein